MSELKAHALEFAVELVQHLVTLAFTVLTYDFEVGLHEPTDLKEELSKVGEQVLINDREGEDVS